MKGHPLGRAMWLSNEQGGLTSSPVTFLTSDSPQVTQVKSLASAMINFHPHNRPKVEDVLKTVMDILGK